MSLAAVTDATAAVAEALDNFAANDFVLRDNLLAHLDRELAEIETERATFNAFLDARREKIADRKVAITNEFDARAGDIYAILNGKG
jgi:hypothetical protein